MKPRKITLWEKILFQIRLRESKHLYRKFKNGKLKMLFVFGHMRSGSSLLLHILNTHNDIIGYGETHNRYQIPEDFGKTTFDIYLAFKKLKVSEKYVLDKPLHTITLHDPELVQEQKMIFIIREPGASIISILTLDVSFIRGPEDACRYYIERLREVRKFARNVPKENWYYCDYDHIVNDTDKVLRELEIFLGLSGPLKKEYETIFTTGQKYFGDSSANIKTGKIQQKKKVVIPEELKTYVEEAQVEYDKTVQLLLKLNPNR